jgi:hypothetical protein
MLYGISVTVPQPTPFTLNCSVRCSINRKVNLIHSFHINAPVRTFITSWPHFSIFVLYMRLVHFTTCTSEDAPFGEAINHTIVWAFHVLRRYFCNIRAVFLFRYGVLSVFISMFLCVFGFLLWSFVDSLGVLFVTNFVLIYSSVGTFVVFIYLLSLLLFWFTVLSLLFI